MLHLRSTDLILCQQLGPVVRVPCSTPCAKQDIIHKQNRRPSPDVTRSPLTVRPFHRSNSWTIRPRIPVTPRNTTPRNLVSKMPDTDRIANRPRVVYALKTVPLVTVRAQQLTCGASSTRELPSQAREKRQPALRPPNNPTNGYASTNPIRIAQFFPAPQSYNYPALSPPSTAIPRAYHKYSCVFRRARGVCPIIIDRVVQYTPPNAVLRAHCTVYTAKGRLLTGRDGLCSEHPKTF